MDLVSFVHLDVLSCYSLFASPATPDDYARQAAGFAPRDDADSPEPRGALAIADYGLHSAVKTAAVCRAHGLQHIPALRVRVVPERAFRGWDERPGELILLAMDAQGWANLVALSNIGHVLGWGGRGFQRGDRFVISVDAADGFAAVRLPRGLARRKAKP
jgi:DNA polymerase III alpha subunit